MDFVFSDVFSLFSIMQAAADHKPLTPSQRAWLKAYKGIAHAVLAAVLLGLYQFFSAHATLAGINWQIELASFSTMAFKAYLDARAKFFTAQAPAEVQTGQLMASVTLPSPIAAPVLPVVAAPAPAPVSGGEPDQWSKQMIASYTADLTGRDRTAARMPTNPMLKNVPLPLSQRSVPDVKH